MTTAQLILQAVISVLTAVLASGGLWNYLSKKQDMRLAELEKQRQVEKDEKSKTEVNNKLLIGIAHDRLMYLTNRYLDNGWISADEYENLMYIYQPYIQSGGNGAVKRNMEKVEKLPTKPECAN